MVSGEKQGAMAVQREQVGSAVLTSQPSDQSFGQGSIGAVRFAKSLVDPTLIVINLWAITHLHGDLVTGAEVLLGMFAFSLSFPGTIPFRQRKLGLLREIAGNWFVVVMLMFGFGYVTGYLETFDREILLAWFASTPLILWLVHVSSPLYVPRIIALQGHQTAIIIGANDLGNRIAATINGDPFEVRRVVAFFDDRSEERLARPGVLPLAGNLKAVAAYVKAARVNLIFVTLPVTSQPRIMALFEDLRDTTASIYYAPDIFMHDLIQARMDSVGNVPVLAVCETPFQGSSGLLKRITDVLISSTALVCAAPMAPRRVANRCPTIEPIAATRSTTEMAMQTWASEPAHSAATASGSADTESWPSAITGRPALRAHTPTPYAIAFRSISACTPGWVSSATASPANTPSVRA